MEEKEIAVKRGAMGLSLTGAGFVFLFNPVIMTIDILPDALGFFLIALGLTKMSYFVGKLASAREMFVRLSSAELLKVFSMLFLQYSDGTGKLLLTFIFSIAEVIMFIPALFKLFEGLDFAAMEYNGTAMYAKKIGKNRKKRKKTKQVDVMTNTRNYILFFYVLRVCLTVIQELTELQMYDYLGEVTAFSRSLSSYKPLLYVLFSIIILILGIIYLCKTCGFFNSLKNDKIFVETLKNKYERDILPRDTFFTARRMKTALFLFSCAALTSFVMTFDGVNIFVGIISSVFLVFAAAVIARDAKVAQFVFPLAAARGIISIVCAVLQIRYFGEYNEEAVLWISGAAKQYYTLAALEVSESVFAIASFVVFLFALSKAVKIHLRHFGIQNDSAQFSKQNRDAEVSNAVNTKLLCCAILAFINFALAAAYYYILVSFQFIVFINSAVSFVFIAYAFVTSATVNSLVYKDEAEII